MVLVELLGTLTGLVKVKTKPDIDNAVFKLHYRITSALLITFSLLVTANGLIGDPIHCLHDDNPKLPDEVVNTYCWIHTTFTLPKHLDKLPGRGIIYPGVGPHKDEDDRTYHAYYQWVPFMLFLQGILFYVPHWLWKAWEDSKVDAIVAGLGSPLMDKEDRKDKVRLLADYLLCSLNYHNIYAVKFVVCEFLNLTNVLANIWFLNLFLGGAFLTYGLDVVSMTEQDQEHRTDPMIVVFPRITKCNFHMYGPSGTVERHDLMCVMALNIINEKIYIFLWFWFIILSAITFLALLYRLLVFCVPSIRTGLLLKRARLHLKGETEALRRRLHVGDYFVLYLLSKNLEMVSYSELLEQVSARLANRAVHPDFEVSAPPPPDHYHLMSDRV
ncbi:innexin inx2-like [Oratosquilla oratoria]|uniref:innexin inx2-like n=1 Tax=Oratosquilla oratoria TaxID=337810 RepID=UPI003F768181